MPQAGSVMKIVPFTRLLITHQEIWFYDGSPVNEFSKNIYYQSSAKPPEHAFSAKEFHTLATNLSGTETTLYSGINRTFRYDIKKGEGMNPEYIVLNLQDSNQLLSYWSAYNRFARKRNLLKLPIWRLRALAASSSLVITIIKQGNQVVSTHSYVQDGVRARLLTSHTEPSPMSGTQLGYYNKFHHWQDMLYFKKLTFEWYDWGGVSANRNTRDGRYYFKQSFGGELQLFYHFITCKNWLRPWLRL